MKIIKKGKLEERKFTCNKCGCIFIADETDKNDITEHWMAIDTYAVNCPTCGDGIEWSNGYKYFNEKEEL